jgi:nicotinamide-nucleotide amidase
MASLKQEIGDLLRQKGLTLGVVESATGGLISHLITNVPGSSDYYKGSVTAYSNETKIGVVGVKASTIEQNGAVSHQVAEEMALGGQQVLGVDVCLADTGIAGPAGATPGKPVGLFYLGLSHQGRTYSQRHEFHGNREQNKRRAAEAALSWLKEYLVSLGDKADSSLEEKNVVTCFLESDGEILILRRSEQVGSYQGRWAGVSGYVETTPDEQALVELEEEASLSEEDLKLIKKGEPLSVEDERLGVRWIVHPYLFHINERNKVRIDWEHKETRWIKPQEMDNYQTVPMLKETLAQVW